MRALVEHTPKFTAALCIAFCLMSLLTPPAWASGIAEEIDNLAERARLTADAFMQQSLQLRLGYEYNSRFINETDKAKLTELAKNATNHLQEIAQIQETLKKKIEDYQGKDWEARYGATGLWRKLASQLQTARLIKSQVDYYLAITKTQPEKTKILHEILAQIDSLSTDAPSAEAQFLKARTTALLAQTELVYKPSVIYQLDAVIAQTELPDCIHFHAIIERIKIIGKIATDQLNALADKLAQSSCADDFELAVSLAFLQRNNGQPEALEEIVQRWPQAKQLLGSIILSKLSYAAKSQPPNIETLQQTSFFEAELAAMAIWKDKTQNYKTLLSSLLNVQRFQTPLILYVAAVKYAESSPAEAINFLIEASKLQQLRQSDSLDIAPFTIARQAAQLAYNSFTGDKQNCPLTMKAFDNYFTLTDDKAIDEGLKYLYVSVLDECDRKQESKKLLEQIANRDVGTWRNRARLDLIIQAIEQEQHTNQKQTRTLLDQLSHLIADCNAQGNTLLRTQALAVYCPLLLESENEQSAQEILNIVTEADILRDPNLSIFKSRALRKLGRLDESAQCLLTISKPNRCEHVDEVIDLLSEFIDRLDQLQTAHPDFVGILRDCSRLAVFSYNCQDNQHRRQEGLYLAELSILAAHKNKDKLFQAEKLLNTIAEDKRTGNVALLRCRARLLTEQGRFEQAAALWAKVANIQKTQMPHTTQQNSRWWRAKFYELDCWAKIPNTERTDVLHTIEVLENSYADIPPLWQEKLEQLKLQCVQIAGKGK